MYVTEPKINTDDQGERRIEPRLHLIRPCKVYHPRLDRYFEGTTINLSCSGALMHIHCPLQLGRADRLQLAIALKRRQDFHCHRDMIDAIVLRAHLTVADHTEVAMFFARPLELAADVGRPYLSAA